MNRPFATVSAALLVTVVAQTSRGQTIPELCQAARNEAPGPERDRFLASHCPVPRVVGQHARKAAPNRPALHAASALPGKGSPDGDPGRNQPEQVLPPSVMCTLDQAQLVQQSKAGKDIMDRLQALAGDARAQLSSEATAIKTDTDALEASRGSLDQAAWQARAANIQLRTTNYSHEADLLRREIQATEQKEIYALSILFSPIGKRVAVDQHCKAVLLSSQVALQGDMVDITPVFVQQLDEQVPSMPPFDLVQLPN